MYDACAVAYDSHARTGPYNALYDRPALLDLAGDVAGRRVLDAGCGPGIYAAELVARGAHVTALDESPEMVRLAQDRLGTDVEVRRHRLGDRLDWLADASVDLVIMALVLHHVSDRVGALRELARVLASDGRLVLSTTHPTHDWLHRGGSYFTSELVEETWQQDWAVRYWRQPLEGWCAEFAEAGFAIEHIAEPRPVDTMAASHPELHDRLSEQPGFIAFRLMKRA